MFYFKKIVSYFDYYENGEKKRSCGYVKILVKGEEVTIDIHLKDAGESGMCEILPMGQEEKRIGRFVIDKGTGYYNACHDIKNIDGQGLSVFDVSGLKLMLSENKYCLTDWDWGKLPEQAVALPEEEIPKEPMGEPVKEAQNEPAKEVQKETVREAQKEATREVRKETVKERMEESLKEFIKEPEEKTEELPTQEPLYEDKWKQLCSTYPVCHPFGEEEEYITITPKDFVVLRKEYQNLVSNSFLLHSFYNYHHVILGKMGQDSDEIYYIGAPGNYFDREKKVAVMFGFEGFARSAAGNSHKQEGQKSEAAAKCGDFGYYMKKVEI